MMLLTLNIFLSLVSFLLLVRSSTFVPLGQLYQFHPESSSILTLFSFALTLFFAVQVPSLSLVRVALASATVQFSFSHMDFPLEDFEYARTGLDH